MLKLRVVGDEKRDMFLVEPGVTIGSAAGAGLLLSADGVQAAHCKIDVEGSDGLTLVNTSKDTKLLVNGKPATSSVPLKIGDEIQVGSVRLMIIDPKAGFTPKAAADAGGAAAASSSPWSIRANHSALNNRTYPISGTMVLGRSNECEITLSVSHLSRKHAELSVVGDKLVVRDLDSANGTFVNGTRVKEETLKKGDELRLDTLSFTVVGPQDDMDKTSVRSAIDPSLLAAAASKPKPAAPVTAASPKATTAARKAAPAPRPNTAAQKPAAAPQAQASEESGGGSGMVIAIVVAVVVIGAAAAYFVL